MYDIVTMHDYNLKYGASALWFCAKEMLKKQELFPKMLTDNNFYLSMLAKKNHLLSDIDRVTIHIL